MGRKYESRAKRLERVLGLLQEGLDEVQMLQEEMESWCNNMQGTNLENTEKYSRVEECTNKLSDAVSSIEDGISNLESVEFPGMYG